MEKDKNKDMNPNPKETDNPMSKNGLGDKLPSRNNTVGDNPNLQTASGAPVKSRTPSKTLDNLIMSLSRSNRSFLVNRSQLPSALPVSSFLRCFKRREIVSQLVIMPPSQR